MVADLMEAILKAKFIRESTESSSVRARATSTAVQVESKSSLGRMVESKSSLGRSVTVRSHLPVLLLLRWLLATVKLRLNPV